MSGGGYTFLVRMSGGGYTFGMGGAFVESFNGELPDECLNTNWFVSLADASTRIEAWRQDYNGHRPHSSLGDLTPEGYARTAA